MYDIHTPYRGYNEYKNTAYPSPTLYPLRRQTSQHCITRSALKTTWIISLSAHFVVPARCSVIFKAPASIPCFSCALSKADKSSSTRAPIASERAVSRTPDFCRPPDRIAAAKGHHGHQCVSPAILRIYLAVPPSRASLLSYFSTPIQVHLNSAELLHHQHSRCLSQLSPTLARPLTT